MKRTLLAVPIVLGCLLFAATPAQADHKHRGWSFRVGFGGHGGWMSASFGGSGRREPVHVHQYTPVYDRVWVQAQYDEVFVGYDHCGRPIYRTVCVRAGHYRSVLVGRRCGCGHRC